MLIDANLLCTTPSRAVHGVQCDVTNSPTRTGTPYGGRLDWMMPGGNKLIVHLKDKMKIRHRKRWSQVNHLHSEMYSTVI